MLREIGPARLIPEMSQALSWGAIALQEIGAGVMGSYELPVYNPNSGGTVTSVVVATGSLPAWCSIQANPWRLTWSGAQSVGATLGPLTLQASGSPGASATSGSISANVVGSQALVWGTIALSQIGAGVIGSYELPVYNPNIGGTVTSVVVATGSLPAWCSIQANPWRLTWSGAQSVGATLGPLTLQASGSPGASATSGSISATVVEAQSLAWGAIALSQIGAGVIGSYELPVYNPNGGGTVTSVVVATGSLPAWCSIQANPWRLTWSGAQSVGATLGPLTLQASGSPGASATSGSISATVVESSGSGVYGPLVSRLLPVSQLRDDGSTVRWYFGKHTLWVGCPLNNKVYGFGGDGTPYHRSASGSGGISPVVSYDFVTDTFQYEYHQGGYEGREMPERLDYVQACWDSTRAVFWIPGGYAWDAQSPHLDVSGTPITGSMINGRMWTFDPFAPIADRFTNVGAKQYPFEKKEQYACAHDPVRDRIVMVRDGALRWFECTNTAVMYSLALSGTTGSTSDTFGRPQFRDHYTDELLWLDQGNGCLMATHLGTAVTRIVKSGLPKPTYVGTQDDFCAFIPRSGRPGVFVLAANAGNGGSWPMKYIDCETGVVTESVYESWQMVANEGCYHPLVNKIFATGSNGILGQFCYSIYDVVARPPAIPAWALSAGYEINKWIQVPATRLRADFPNADNIAKGLDDPVWTGSRSNAKYLGYSGMALRKRSSSLLLAASAGGGERAGNDIIELCLEDAAPAWRTVLPSEPASAFPSYAEGGYPVRTTSGKPNAAHNYRSLHYAEFLDELWRITSKNHWPRDAGWGPHWERWVWGSASWGTAGPNMPWDGTYMTDLPNQAQCNFGDKVLVIPSHATTSFGCACTDASWRLPVNNPSNFVTSTGHPYDSTFYPLSDGQRLPHIGGMVWHLWNNAEGRLTWFGINRNGSGNQADWSPFVGTVATAWYDSPSHRYKAVTLTGTGAAEFSASSRFMGNNWEAKSVIWDVDNECFLVFFPTERDIFELRWSTYPHDYDADTLVVTKLVTTGTGPQVSRGDGIYDRFVYVPHLRGVALVNDEWENVFFLRRK